MMDERKAQAVEGIIEMWRSEKRESGKDNYARIWMAIFYLSLIDSVVGGAE